MTTLNHILLSVILSVILFTHSAFAHNKVVVIPLGETTSNIENTVKIRPSFRIIDTSNTGEAPTLGRLEYTSDERPSSKSVWGKVCDDCFEGGHGDCPATSNSPHSAAIAVCKDLGFDRGEVLPDGIASSTGALDFTLDNVVCPTGSNSFTDCTSEHHNSGSGMCSLGDEVTIACSNDPVVVDPGKITLDDKTVSCGQSEGRIDLFPQEYNRLITGMPPSIAAGTNTDFDIRDRSIVTELGDPVVLLEVNTTRIFDRNYDCSGISPSSNETVDFSFATNSGVTWRVTGNITISGGSPNGIGGIHSFSIHLTNWSIETVPPA